MRMILLGQNDEKDILIESDQLIAREDIERSASLLGSDAIKVIFGVRRSGKSTLAHQFLADKEYAYINFDDERLVGIDRYDLDRLFQIAKGIAGGSGYALFDEIQNIDGWELFVNRLQREGVDLTVTGSSANLLSTELSTHLTGRYLPISLLPFSFREFLLAKRISVPDLGSLRSADVELLAGSAEEYLRLGGFPKAVLDPDNASLYLRTLYSDIINKDVIVRFKPKYTRTLRELSLFLINSSSNLMTYSSLMKRFDLGSIHTVKNYVHYLVEASLLVIVEKFTFRQRERSASPKKVYSVDTGLVQLLSSSPGDPIANLLENAVAVDLFRRASFDPALSINYWRNYQDHEVDLVLSRDRKVEKLIQVSAISELDGLRERETRSLVRASRELKCSDLLLITWNLEGRIEEKGMEIEMVPFWKWTLFPDLVPSLK